MQIRTNSSKRRSIHLYTIATRAKLKIFTMTQKRTVKGTLWTTKAHRETLERWKTLRKEGREYIVSYRNSKNEYPRKKGMEWWHLCSQPITLYSSASRLSSMTSAVGNGFSCGLLSPLSSDILTVLPDFLPLQRINRGCRVLRRIFFFFFFFLSRFRLTLSAKRFTIDSRISS